ncbi:MAG: N-acetyltransferase family protein [Gaiellaceae bacterium]
MRAAKPGDADGLVRAVLDLADQYVALDPERFQRPPAEELLARTAAQLREPLPDDRAWLVAEVEGAAVGGVGVRLDEPFESAATQPQRDVGRRRAHVTFLAVQEAQRSRGIGSRLMLAAEEWARVRGAELIVTDTHIGSESAIRFYKRLGYETRGVILRKRLDAPSGL